MYKIRTEASFAAAHRLPDHPGKCKNLHGHRWRVVVEIETNQVDEDTGMVIDFYNFKRIVRHYTEYLDHKYLNEDIPPLKEGLCFFPPTAENLARYLHGEIKLQVGAALKPGTGFHTTIMVEESPGNQVFYSDELVITAGTLNPHRNKTIAHYLPAVKAKENE